MSSLMEFNLLNTRVQIIKKKYSLDHDSTSFLYLMLEKLFPIDEMEIEESIVDGGNDRGIDAIYIEDDENLENPVIHIIQSKYTSKSNNINNHFPGNAVDKIITILNEIINSEEINTATMNPELVEKIGNIRLLFEKCRIPHFKIIFCGNMQKLIKEEQDRLEYEFKDYPNIIFKYYDIDKISKLISTERRKKINGKIQFIGNQYLTTSNANIRAVIGVVSALDLVELITDKDNEKNINESIFDDNIRMYRGKEKNPVNRSIFETALSEKNHEFVYLNNGITITCEKFDYFLRPNMNVDLENLQIVNGSQTSHALFEAYHIVKESSPEIFNNVLVLVKIYETQKDIINRIVQTTNSQTSIDSRDLRANDSIQLKIQTELLDKGWFYETKRNQYEDKDKNKRLDASLVGQVLLSFYGSRPHEVKFRKREIFGKNYEEVFNPCIVNADSILYAIDLFNFIETKKNIYRRSKDKEPKYLFLPHASFFILYGFKVILDAKKEPLALEKIDKVKVYYDTIIQTISKLVASEQKRLPKRYTHNSFFRNKITEKNLENEINEVLKRGITVL